MNEMPGTVNIEAGITLKGYTLIIPSVSVGNVGQLTVDYLISTLKAKHVGFLYHPAILPVIGSDPYDLNSKSLMISSAIYIVDSLKLALIQLRSPLLQQYQESFLEEVLDWIKKSCIQKVIILTSSFAYERRDEQITGTPLRYLMTKDLLNGIPQKLDHWKQLEANNVLATDVNEIYSIPGGGFAGPLFTRCVADSISASVLLIFCSEGNNIPDAFMLANYLNEWLKVVPADNQWVNPPSWKHLFGNAPVKELY